MNFPINEVCAAMIRGHLRAYVKSKGGNFDIIFSCSSLEHTLKEKVKEN